MKKLISCAMLLIIATASFSQQTNPSQPLTRADYLKKSKNQKTVGWILLTGGTIMAVGGLISLGHNYYYGSNTATDISGFLMLGGIVSDIVSIPFFIASARNKRKAMSLSFKNETVPQIQKSSFVYRSVPSVTLKIRL